MAITQKTLQQGTELRSSKERYEIVSVLGMGNFGITYRAKVEIMHGNIPIYGDVAIKEFFMSSICMREADGSVSVNAIQRKTFSECREDFRKEAEALKKMADNKGVVKVNETFEANGTCYYVMEYLGDVSLKRLVAQSGPMGEEEAMALLCKIATAVGSLHSQNRLHLDIKPGNIMMPDGEPKLIDFGQSLQFGKSGAAKRRVSAACSDGYAPPEQYSGIRHFKPQADIYALGAVLFFMLTGKKPLPASELTPEYIDRELPQGISANVRGIVRKCLSKYAAKRYESIAEMLRLLPAGDDADGDDGTTLLADVPRPNIYYKRKVVGIVLGVIVAAAMILLVAFIVGQCRSDATPPAKAADKVETAAETDSITDRQEGQPVREDGKEPPADKAKDEDRAEPPQDSKAKDAQAASVASSNDANPIASPAKPTNAANTAKARRTVSLGWATWSGKCDGYGNPTGFGTLTVTQKKQIRESVVLYPGDRIVECEFYGNAVYQGTLYRAGSSQPEYISPE